MTPNTFEIVTALTVATIGAILLLYFIVLKRKGWLRENSHESFYLCPNLECRKIFQKPIILTDLSQTPARVHPACPHCGFDLETIPPFKAQKKPETVIAVPLSPKKPTVTIEDLLSTKKKRPEEPVTPVKTSKPEISVEPIEVAEKRTAVAKETRKPPEEPIEEPPERVEAPITKEKQSSPPTKSLQARPPECHHFFGYLKKIPKNTSIPDECFGCSKMVECLYYSISE